MNTPQSPLSNFVMRFAEISDQVGKRLHIGCVMAAGQDWVEVSLPEHADLGSNLQVRFLPSDVTHEVKAGWRADDRIGFTYAAGGPPEEHFAGLPGLLDPRPAFLKIGH
ncbi:hypothetical protein [Aestuariivirga litoralis]|uniref:hypothetical protein n=1 Tax=Aestuariivirga litoralis TaxID=2650924 RepID=UPI0011B512EC|nr:hypothetical protein [Aestuariivirga litoralis]